MKRCLNCMEEYEEGYDRCPQCLYQEGEHPSRPFVLKEGSILQGRYIVGTCLRIHDCFIMYIGWDALFERRVMIQEFYPSGCAARQDEKNLTVKSGMENLYHESLNRFVHYHRNLIRLYKEPDIICVYSCFKANGTAYATMQYSGAETLREWMAGSRIPDEREAMAILYQATEAVKKVHGLGLIHGDLGLDSFWITRNGQLVLKDFAEPWHYCGDPDMMDYQNVGPWIDVYGLSMLFGKLILRQEEAQAADILKRLSREDLKLPVRAVLAIRGGLDETGRRIQSLDEFADRIFADAATMRLVNQSGKKLMEGGQALGFRRRLLAICIALAAFGAAGWTAYNSLGWKEEPKAIPVEDRLDISRLGIGRWDKLKPDKDAIRGMLLETDQPGTDQPGTGITTENGIVTEDGRIVNPGAAKESEAGEKSKAAEESKAAEKSKAAKESETAEKSKAAEESKAAERSKAAKESEAAEKSKAAKESEAGEKSKAAEESEAGEKSKAAEETEASVQTEAVIVPVTNEIEKVSKGEPDGTPHGEMRTDTQ